MSLVITFPFSPILVQLGPIAIRWYGLGYAVAFMVGLAVVARHLKRYKLTERDWGDLAFWAIVIGLIAARLYYVVQSNLGFYLTHPQHILAFWEGGMAYFGAIWTVPLVVLVYCKWKKLAAWPVLDAAVLFAAVGQPIGRIGNIFNGDILGYPSNLPWAFRYTSPDTFAPQIGTSYQPAALYELLTGLVILGILLLIRGRVRPRPGGLFVTYLGLYAISQFGIFFLRANDVVAFGLKQAQLSAIVLAIITLALGMFWYRTSVPRDSARLTGDGSAEPEPKAEEDAKKSDAKEEAKPAVESS
jgi:phosphatidylglycerol:prolipoprotein diacylglycerol transferase